MTVTPPAAEGHDAAPTAPGLRMHPELREQLLDAMGDLGGVQAEIAAAYREGLTTPSTVAASGVTASGAWIGGMLLRIRVMLGEAWPNTPGRAQKCAATVRQVLAQPALLPESRQHLLTVLGRLAAAENDPDAQVAELAELSAESRQLETTMLKLSGVYVYTFPQYWRFPHSQDSGRRLLKVGKTTQGAWKRILDQARATAMPEDPLLLRVYATDDPDLAERTFHRLLDAADHTRQKTHAGGREWFSTTLLFLDEIAAALNLPVHAATLAD